MVLYTIFIVREIRRNEQHDAFINAVTHELKTRGFHPPYSQTLQTREIDETKRREFYRIMLEDSDRLLHTIDQVLRAGSTASRFRRTARMPVDMGDIARECVALARTRFHLGEDSLSYDDRIGSGSAVVIGDADELKAAVWNLIDNAVKYSPERVKVRVVVEEGEGQRVAVRVVDSGVGISPEELKRIFTRFYRIPASVAMRAKGSGLGLFIVRSVAKKHGGRAFAQSTGTGQGSTFTLLLPRGAKGEEASVKGSGAKGEERRVKVKGKGEESFDR
jgi:signal transduction histidine kinase